jgi:hypothetical protein
MDWVEFNKQLLPGLAKVLDALLTGLVLIIGALVALILAKINKAKDAEVAVKETEAFMADFNRGEAVARTAVLAAEMNPEVQGSREKLSYAMEAMTATVPKLGNGLHRKLVEAAVIEATHGTEAPIGMAERLDKVPGATPDGEG